MAPNGARFMINAQSLRRLKLPASCQPLATVRNSEYHVDASPLAKRVLRFDPQLLNLCPRSESEKEATLQRPKSPRCLDSWIDLLRKRVPDVSATRGLDSFQDLRLLLMKLFHPALTNQEQHNFGPIPHLFPWPSMTVVCCLARRAQSMYMGNPPSRAFHGFTDVFFQLPAQTKNRVELGIATRSISWAATAQWLASSRKALGGMVLIGIKMSLFVLHPCTGT